MKGDIRKPHQENAPSLLLSEADNQALFALIGQRCQSLASAVVEVYLAVPPNRDEWTKECCGVATFIKDNKMKSYFIRLYDIEKKELIWEQELYKQFIYKTQATSFHSFDADQYQAGLNFSSEEEATNFGNAITGKLKEREDRIKQARLSKQQLKQEMENDHEEATNAPVIHHVIALKPKQLEKQGHKDKKKHLGASDIWTPTGFTRIRHLGWDPDKGFDLQTLDPDMKLLFAVAGVSNDMAKDPAVSNFIRYFIEKRGGEAAVKVAAQSIKRESPQITADDSCGRRRHRHGSGVAMPAPTKLRANTLFAVTTQASRRPIADEVAMDLRSSQSHRLSRCDELFPSPNQSPNLKRPKRPAPPCPPSNDAKTRGPSPGHSPRQQCLPKTLEGQNLSSHGSPRQQHSPQTLDTEKEQYLHPSSPNARRPVPKPPVHEGPPRPNKPPPTPLKHTTKETSNMISAEDVEARPPSLGRKLSPPRLPPKPKTNNVISFGNVEGRPPSPVPNRAPPTPPPKSTKPTEHKLVESPQEQRTFQQHNDTSAFRSVDINDLPLPPPPIIDLILPTPPICDVPPPLPLDGGTFPIAPGLPSGEPSGSGDASAHAGDGTKARSENNSRELKAKSSTDVTTKTKPSSAESVFDEIRNKGQSALKPAPAPKFKEKCDIPKPESSDDMWSALKDAIDKIRPAFDPDEENGKAVSEFSDEE